ncbi:40S ribosomal protein S13-like [Trifolium pratense]|uniref:40S ribosomal protein S13-like n=1 Tax=Trifolium pratense TaxID=57577 RepID=UPI001E692ECF|nr:40S ribosomal protein S13-like [Trifolium pratense]
MAPFQMVLPSWSSVRGLTLSQIGVILRDSHGIAQVKNLTGNKILRILKTHGLAPEIPEDLYHLIKKAVSIRKHLESRKHLERNRKDKDSKFRLILVESRIHRLAGYYKKTKKLPPVWKYESTTASTRVA